MNLKQMLKSVKEEVSGFLDQKKAEQVKTPRTASGPYADKFVKSTSNDLMDVKTKTRYVNGICYGG